MEGQTETATPVVEAAPVPLTVAPEPTAEAPRVKRKYTKKAKKEKKMKSVKAKKMKTEKKAKRVAGTKAQGQVSKTVFRFMKNLAKEQDVPVARLVSEAVTSFATRRGLKLDET